MTPAATVRAVVIGIGNEYRRDDGVGPAVAARIAAHRLPGIEVLTCPAEPAVILDAWDGADLAILVDGAVGDPPGRIRQWAVADLQGPAGLGGSAPVNSASVSSASVSSHDLGLGQTYRLGRALQRVPADLAVVTVGVLDTGHGVGLSPAVEAALPGAVSVVRGLLGAQLQEAAHQ